MLVVKFATRGTSTPVLVVSTGVLFSPLHGKVVRFMTY